MEGSRKLCSTKYHKKIGIGTLSTLLFVLGLLFSFSFGSYGAPGDTILRIVGLSPWSNGSKGWHYTLFYSLFFYLPARIIGSIFIMDLGAKFVKTLSRAMIIVTLVFSLAFIV